MNEVKEVRSTWIAAAAAFAAALVLYLGVRHVGSYDFVNYDDVTLVSRQNPAIGKGLVAGLPDLLDLRSPHPFMDAWLPLYYWSIGLDHALGGGAAWIFHVHSILLHALGAAMVVLIARRLGATSFVAGLAGVLFALHPAATESVAWVASRKDVLSFVWMAAAALCYLDGVAKKRPALHAWGVVCLVVSMTAKGTTLVLPFLLAVHALLLRRDATGPRRLLPVVPYSIAAAAMTAVHLSVASLAGTTTAAEPAGLGRLLVLDLQVVWRYCVALLLPLVQSVEHGVRPQNVDGVQVFLGAAIVVATVIAVAVTWRRHRAVAAVLLAVVFALLPFNNVLPRTSVQFAERYVYVALLPLTIGAAWLLRPRGAVRLAPAVAAAGIYAAIAVVHLPVWRDSVALWTDAAAKAPSSSLVQCQLAEARVEAWRRAGQPRDSADMPAALSALRAAKALATTELELYRAESGLATQLFVTSGGSSDPAAQLREAVASFQAAREHLERLTLPGVATQLVEILTNRASCEELLGENDAAFAHWTEAVHIDGQRAQAWNALARLHLLAGRGKEAGEALARSQTASHEPLLVKERLTIRTAAGDFGGAKRDLAEAIEANPADADLLVLAARLDAQLQRPVDAESNLRRALALRPDDASIQELLAASLLDQAQAQAARDDMTAAREAAEKAVVIAPKSSAPEQVLGIVARRSGELEEAAAHFRKARDLHPEGVRIREQLASVLVELAAQFLDAKRDALALMLLEEAVAARPEALATPKGRFVGVTDWPDPVRDDDRLMVARNAALKALAFLATGRASEAAPELLVAETGAGGGADPRLLRAIRRLSIRVHFALGRRDDAVLAARELAKLDVPGDGEWNWRRHAESAAAFAERAIARRNGEDAGAADDIREARAALETARVAGMPLARLHTRLGEILFVDHDFLAATKEFETAASLDPSDVDALLDRAEVWRTQFLGEDEKTYLTEAEKDLRRAAAISPSDPRVLAKLGETLVLLGKPNEGFPWLQRAVLSDPSQSAARSLLCELSVRAGRSHLEKYAGASGAQKQRELAEARASADRAVALDAPSADALVFLADVLRVQGDWAGAATRYELAHRRFPDSSAALDSLAKFHMDRGLLLLLHKKSGDAVADFQKALSFEKTTVDLSLARTRLHEIAVTSFGEAMSFDAEGKPQEAAERFALSLAAEPTSMGHFARAVVLAKAGRNEDALPEYDAALAMDPHMLPARLNRAAILSRLGRLDEAALEYRAWIAAAPGDDPDHKAVEQQILRIDDERRESSRPR